MGFVTVLPRSGPIWGDLVCRDGVGSMESGLESRKLQMSGRSAAW